MIFLKKIYYWLVFLLFWMITAIIYIPMCWILAAILAGISSPLNGEFTNTFYNILYEVRADCPEKVYSPRAVISEANEGMVKWVKEQEEISARKTVA